MKATTMTLTLVALGGLPTLSASAANGGQLTISGAIVAASCDASQQRESMQVTCDSGTQSVNLTQLAQEPSRDLTRVQLVHQWIDPQHTRAIITLDHN